MRYKFVNEKMLIAPILATNKCVGEQIQETILRNKSSFFVLISCKNKKHNTTPV